MWNHTEKCNEYECYCADEDDPDPICDCGCPGWACECPTDEEEDCEEC